MDGADDEELCAELFPDVCINNAFTSSASRDGESRRVFCARVDVVSVSAIDAKLRICHRLCMYGFSGLVFE